MDTEGGADNIHNRVYCPHLVEVNLINGKAVSLRLCLSHQAEHLSRHAAHILVLQPVKDTVDIVNIAVNMGVVMCMAVIMIMAVVMVVIVAVVVIMAVVMIVVMAVAMVMIVAMVMPVAMIMPVAVDVVVTFPVTVQMNVEIVGIDTTFLRPSEMQMIALYSQLFKGLLQLLPGGPQI